MEPRTPSTAFADAWTKVDATENPGFFVDLLDATRVELLNRARRSPAEFFAAHDLRPGIRVLDAGCGTGDMLRLIAPLVAPGRCVGVDLSETMIGEARRRATDPLSNLTFQTGNAQALDFEDASFDRATATQLLVHVPEPSIALAELRRVLVPGGRLVIGEVDWSSISFECSRRELARRFVQLASDELRNGYVVRELGFLLREAGFADVQLFPEVTIAHAVGAFQTWFIEPGLRHLVAIGAFSEREAAGLVDDLNERSRTGRYFLSRTYHAIAAVRRA